MSLTTEQIEQFEDDLHRKVRIIEPSERLVMIADTWASLGDLEAHAKIKHLAEFALSSVWTLSMHEQSFLLYPEGKSRVLDLLLTILDEKIVFYTSFAERFAKTLSTSDLSARWPCLFMQLAPDAGLTDCDQE